MKLSHLRVKMEGAGSAGSQADLFAAAPASTAAGGAAAAVTVVA